MFKVKKLHTGQKGQRNFLKYYMFCLFSFIFKLVYKATDIYAYIWCVYIYNLFLFVPFLSNHLFHLLPTSCWFWSSHQIAPFCFHITGVSLPFPCLNIPSFLLTASILTYTHVRACAHAHTHATEVLHMREKHGAFCWFFLFESGSFCLILMISSSLYFLVPVI